MCFSSFFFCEVENQTSGELLLGAARPFFAWIVVSGVALGCFFSGQLCDLGGTKFSTVQVCLYFFFVCVCACEIVTGYSLWVSVKFTVQW